MNQVIEEVSAEENSDFWKAHVISAQNFIGSDEEYCRRNDIKHKTFRSYKKKYGYTKQIKRRLKPFVEMKSISSTATEVRVMPHHQKRTVPDAKWVAEFVATLLSQ